MQARVGLVVWMMALCIAALNTTLASNSNLWFPGMLTTTHDTSSKTTRHLYTSNRSGNDHIVFDNNDTEPADINIARGIQLFAIKLDLAIREGLGTQGISRTVVFSPLSVASVLALVLLGAGGRTHDEVASALGLSHRPTSTDIHMHFGRLLDQFLQRPASSTLGSGRINSSPGQALVGKAVFVQRDLELTTRFLQLSRTAYHSEVFPLDFEQQPNAAQLFINRWVSHRTGGKINELLTEPPASHTRLILASALYFRGIWLYPFPEEGTLVRPFKVSPSESVPVSMMVNSIDVPYVKSAELRCALVGLPYNFTNPLEQVTTYLLLPDEEGPEAVISLMERLGEHPEALDGLVAAATVRSVIVTLPRLRLDSALPLVPALRKLGLRTLFSPQHANLSGMIQTKPDNFESPPVYVEQVRHRVTLEFTETGTEAAAATAAFISRDGSQRLFRADRPFVFVMRHHLSGLPLFWGSVMRPN